MLKIRPFTVLDMDKVRPMARAMAEESPRYRRYTYDEDKVTTLMYHFVTRGGAFVAERGDEIVGMMAGACAEAFFGREKYASDLVTYVKPEFRGSSAFVRLVKAFETWARAQGAIDVILGVSCELEMEKTRKVYEKIGYNLSGHAFRKGS